MRLVYEEAKKLGMEVQHASNMRAKLILKGMIYSPHHGDADFTVPLFGDFMRREMGVLKPKEKRRKRKRDQGY